MKLRDAIALIRPGVDITERTWADFGAGAGTFSLALAELLGPAGEIFAVDRDPTAVQMLRKLEAAVDHERASIRAVEGDFRNLDNIVELVDVSLDGALFANALHFVPNAEEVLAHAVAHVRPGGRVLTIEYDGVPPTRWVPHPLPIDRLESIAPRAGLTAPQVIGVRRSSYRGSLYCAVAVRR